MRLRINLDLDGSISPLSYDDLEEVGRDSDLIGPNHLSKKTYTWKTND